MTDKVLLLNSDALRVPATSVTKDTVGYVVDTLIPKMVQVMNQEKGIGLAANQIGDTNAVFVLGLEGEQPKAYINPTVTNESDEIIYDEACLSIPGATARVKRFNKLKLSYLDEQLNPQEVELEGLKAIAVQHEMDHLAGKLYIDRLGDTSRMMAVNKHKKFLKFRSKMR